VWTQRYIVIFKNTTRQGKQVCITSIASLMNEKRPSIKNCYPTLKTHPLHHHSITIRHNHLTTIKVQYEQYRPFRRHPSLLLWGKGIQSTRYHTRLSSFPFFQGQHSNPLGPPLVPNRYCRLRNCSVWNDQVPCAANHRPPTQLYYNLAAIHSLQWSCRVIKVIK